MQSYYTTFQAMGCRMSAWLETDGDGTAILQQVPGWVEEIEARLSRFRLTSELSQLNNRSGEWVVVSPVLLANILAAKHAARLTDGLYNPLVLPALIAAGYDRSFDDILAGRPSPPTPLPQGEGRKNIQGPMDGVHRVHDWQAIELDLERSVVRLPAGAAIDLGGIAKGWTATTIADRLAAYGPCLMDAGGDLVARGLPEYTSIPKNHPGWKIEVAEPWMGDDAPPALTVCLTDAAIVTSGIDYRRWKVQTENGERWQHHLIDPRTGQPAETDIVAATVIHPDAPTAEAYAKALILLGSLDGLAWINQQWDAAAMVVRADAGVLSNEIFRSYILQEQVS
jgi:FAD:protein FMN transferase